MPEIIITYLGLGTPLLTDPVAYFHKVFNKSDYFKASTAMRARGYTVSINPAYRKTLGI